MCHEGERRKKQGDVEKNMRQRGGHVEKSSRTMAVGATVACVGAAIDPVSSGGNGEVRGGCVRVAMSRQRLSKIQN